MTETTFTSECENIVQHICEEHYHVPVPVPVPVPHHHPHPPHVPFGPAPNPNGRKRRRRKKRSSIMKRKKRASSLEREQLILGLKQALGVPAPPPLLFHQELPAPPGCRSLVTQKCHKVGKTSNKFFFCYCAGSYLSFPSIRQIIIWPKRDSASHFFVSNFFKSGILILPRCLLSLSRKYLRTNARKFLE